MTLDFTSFLLNAFVTVAVSGAVSSLVIYLVRTWITERLKQAIAHEYAQKLEAHRAALKSDYDVQLERLRAENAKQLAIEASARASLSDAYRAAHERRLAAIERAWGIILKIRSACTPAFLFLDILHDREQETAPNNPNFRAIVTRSQADPLEDRLHRASEGMDEIRPFVGDRIYALLWVYRAMCGRTEVLLQQSLDKGRLDSWWKDSGIQQLLRIVLTQHEITELDRVRFGRFDQLRSILETKLLQECQPIISGEAAARFSLEQANAIAEAARATNVRSPEAL